MELKDFFKIHNKVALGFSGGVDSVYLLYAAVKYGADVAPYYVNTPFQPRFELDDARKAAQQIGAKLRLIDYDILSYGDVAENSAERCYYCKSRIFKAITDQAAGDGYTTIIDGTNASDREDDRPGIRALKELKILSPLRECGITKQEIRALSREAGLFTWSKPAYACLATRIPTDEKITSEKLDCIENGEDVLFRLGFTDFRIRFLNGGARIQIPEDQMSRLMDMRNDIVRELEPYFNAVLLDLKGR